MTNISKLKKIIIAGLLLATTIVLNRFLSVKTPVLVVSFSFIPVMLSGILLGPWWTMAVAGLADLIGALLFPFGSYFVGYTISAVVSGFIYGMFLQKKFNTTKKRFIINLVISTLLVLIICNAGLNSLWIHITLKKAIWVILPTRLLKQLIMLPIQVVSIFFIDLGLEKIGVYKKLADSEEIIDPEDNEKSKEKNNDKV